jgi:uncharacterized protein
MPLAPTSDDAVAARLRGFGPIGILAFLLIAAATVFVGPYSAFLVLVWVQCSRTPWREIGYVRPKSWIVSAIAGIALGVAFKFLMKAIVMPLLGTEPTNPAYHYLQGNSAALPGILFLMIVGAGFGEETLYRGYLFERLGKLFGSSVAARTAIVLITSAAFGLLHYPDQGLSGAEQATITGLVFGTIFSISGRIWMLMCVHAAFDVTAVAIIYWNLENAVARLIFK